MKLPKTDLGPADRLAVLTGKVRGRLQSTVRRNTRLRGAAALGRAAAAVATGDQAATDHLIYRISDRPDPLYDLLAAILIADAAGQPPTTDERDRLRRLALGLFELIDRHPWLGSQLVRHPWQVAVLRIFERAGAGVSALGVPAARRFDAASAFVTSVLGLAAQYAAGLQLLGRDSDRSAVLAGITAEWESLPAVEFPFVHEVAPVLRTHDDRAQFLAGIDLVIAGMRAAV